MTQAFSNETIMSEDFDQIQGLWKMIESRTNGVINKTGFENTVFQFCNHRYVHIRTRYSSRFILRQDLCPKEIDFVQVSTRITVPAIYELCDDVLIIMYKGKNALLPQSFDDPKCEVWTYQRYKRKLKIKRRVKAQVSVVQST